jgi:hypothetical protein
MKAIAKLGTVVLTAAVFIGLPTDQAAAQSESDPAPTVIAFPTWDTMPQEAITSRQRTSSAPEAVFPQFR